MRIWLRPDRLARARPDARATSRPPSASRTRSPRPAASARSRSTSASAFTLLGDDAERGSPIPTSSSTSSCAIGRERRDRALEGRRARRARRARLCVLASRATAAAVPIGAAICARRERARSRGRRQRNDGPSSARRFPTGLSWTIPYDTTQFVAGLDARGDRTRSSRRSCSCSLVVLLFLQNLRATLDPGRRRARVDHRHVRGHVSARLLDQSR